MITITPEKIEELKQRISLYACALVAGKDDEAERVFAQIEGILDLAQRAMVPQPQEGQALPELPGRDDVHHYYWEHPISGQTFYKYASHWSTGPARAKPLFTAEQMHAYARAYASQLALQAAAVPDVAAIRNAALEEAAKLAYEAMFTEIGARQAKELFLCIRALRSAPAVAQPVADERAGLALYEVRAHTFMQPNVWKEVVKAEYDRTPAAHRRIVYARAALCPPAEEGGKA